MVSFHSLEDRIVKRFLREASSTPSASRHVPLAAQDDPVFSQVSKAIKPGEAEIERNPRARSSVLRHATAHRHARAGGRVMVGGSRIRQIGWALVLAVCFALLLALTFKVNAVKSDVRLAERQIIAAQQAKLMLETEFETRASQQQLSDWNAVEFGYSAPRADQYLESERQLAALGTPRGSMPPSPVRVALNRPARESEGLFAEWIEGEGGRPSSTGRTMS